MTEFSPEIDFGVFLIVLTFYSFRSTLAVFDIRIIREFFPGSLKISRHHVRYRENGKFSAHIIVCRGEYGEQGRWDLSLVMDRVVQIVMINKCFFSQINHNIY